MIDKDQFTLRTKTHCELAAQAYSDLTNDHNARVFFSNIMPISFVGEQISADAYRADYVLHSAADENATWVRYLNRTLAQQPVRKTPDENDPTYVTLTYQLAPHCQLVLTKTVADEKTEYRVVLQLL